MTEQQQHLQQLVAQLNDLGKELESLKNASASKSELFWKVQGAIEYLTKIGVRLPEPEKVEEEKSSEVEVDE